MITEADVTRTVHQRVKILQCTECGAQYDMHEREAAAAHMDTHEPLRYYNPSGYGAVWVTEHAVVRGSINHKRDGNKLIAWEGEGWYVMHEYQVHYHGCDVETRREFISVAEATAKLKEKFQEMSQDWRYYAELRKAPKP